MLHLERSVKQSGAPWIDDEFKVTAQKSGCRGLYYKLRNKVTKLYYFKKKEHFKQKNVQLVK